MVYRKTEKPAVVIPEDPASKGNAITITVVRATLYESLSDKSSDT